jgi:hypothetical protein
MMHPVHPLPDGDVTVGAGFSGTVPVAPSQLQAVSADDQVLEEGAIAPGLAPWVSARLGLASEWEAGLTYTGRSARADIRHAFLFGGADESQAISLGVGASGLLPKRREDLGLRVGGFGFDVPVLYGWRSSGDIYSLWLGPRGGAEYLNGQREVSADPLDPTSAPVDGRIDPISGWHAQVGGVVGMRVGLRYIYAAFELDAMMHWAEGSIGDTEVSLSQFALAPAGAVVVKF